MYLVLGILMISSVIASTGVSIGVTYYDENGNVININGEDNNNSQDNNETPEEPAEVTLDSLLARIEVLEQRVTELESWRITVTETLNMLMNSVPLFTAGNNYLKYLSKTYKKKMVCGYMQEMELTEYSDLDLDCTAKYKTYRSGRIRQICNCI